jgi:8-hydroxy-5-deazaflavin:NADPH oxidoreductase
MNIGILGAGQMGRTLARLFLAAGHEVALANRRGPAELASLVAQLGPGAQALRPGELAACSDVLVLAVRWAQIPEAIAALGPVTGKIVLDTTNNRVGPGPQDVVDLAGRGSSEVVAEMLPGARVVKVFNNQPIASLPELADPAAVEPKAVFLAGDDESAKAVVSALVRSLGSVDAIDTGSLAVGGRLQNTGSGRLAGFGRLLSATEAREALRLATSHIAPQSLPN